MTKAYEKYMKDIRIVEGKIWDAEKEDYDIGHEIFNKKRDCKTAMNEGGDVQQLMADLENLYLQHKKVKRKLSTLDTEIGKTMSDYTWPRKVIEAEKILNDNQNRIGKVQGEFDRKVEELLPIKKQYLKVVAEMKELNREAECYAYECVEVAKHSKPFEEELFFRGLVTDINEMNMTGSIFIQPEEIMKVYQ